VACAIMAGAQIAVIALLWAWGAPIHAAAIAILLLIQVWAMAVMLRDPKGKAPWYNGPGVGAYVSGMMIAAVALRSLA
ncbi:MAG: bacteriochlorophyll/chlorophyll a synthase, partial [Pseudomonadota bacterium]